MHKELLVKRNPVNQKFKPIVNFLNTQNFDQALIEIQLLIQKYPNSSKAFNLQGIIQMSLNKYQEAKNSFQKSFDLNSKYVDPLNNLGLIYFKEKNFKKSIYFYEKAISHNNKFTLPYLNLSIIYIESEDYKKAIKLLKQLVLIDKNSHLAFYNLFKIYIQINKHELAIKNLKKAISIDKYQVNYLKDLGNTYISMGQFETGINYLMEYLELYPNSTDVFSLIGLVKKFKEKDQILTKIFSIDQNTLPEVRKADLYFTLGKIFNDLENYDKSFFYYKKANNLKEKLNPYDIENEKKLLPIIKRKFENKNKIKFIKNIKSNPKQPIFILGMPRSGTSLIEQILSKHTKITALGEVGFLTKELSKLDLVNENLTNNNIELLKKNYISKVLMNDINTPFFTDKTPLNFKWIGFIANAFPNVKIINIKRDIKPLCWSNYKSNFNGEANNFSNKLTNIIEYYKIYREIMSFYIDNFNDQIFTISYEKFINNFNDELRDLLSFLGLKWENECQNFFKGKRYVNTASFAQVKKNIYLNSSEEWKLYEKYLSNHFKDV